MIYLAITAAVIAGIFCGAACTAMTASNRISELQGLLQESLTKDQVEYVLHSQLMPEGQTRIHSKADPATYRNGAIASVEKAMRGLMGL